MSDQDKTNPKNEDKDKELADLLDSALQDFGGTKNENQNDNSATESKDSNEVVKSDADLPQEWSAEYVQQAAMQFEENFAKLISGGDPNATVGPDVVQEKLKQMADAAQQVLANPTDVSDQSVDFAASISQAIAGLSQGQENLRTPGFNEEDLMKMFGGGGGAGGQEADFLPFMQGMMQGLLSKEVLGPSLQDFIEKLPPYLEKNKDTLSKEDAERYENQRKLMEEVLEELNKEQETDSTEVKKERFSKVLALMQKLQDYGQPPAELVGDADAPFTFDPSGNPLQMPNLPDPTGNPECCIM
ncbi:peroxisomal biogenesis factor 19 [Anthonomus grandis grandis]|uniref:peroxisomal biogenesis factor 19 n=1 Tax=Anthonomus grandis grandis TaxID=2921223 RepID=UPI002165016A|nr:peroxisomal biogenesis factor 19 [Anthonomus grandis grandis]